MTVLEKTAVLPAVSPRVADLGKTFGGEWKVTGEHNDRFEGRALRVTWEIADDTVLFDVCRRGVRVMFESEKHVGETSEAHEITIDLLLKYVCKGIEMAPELRNAVVHALWRTEEVREFWASCAEGKDCGLGLAEAPKFEIRGFSSGKP